MKVQMLLVFRHLHLSFRSPDDVGIFKSVGKVVDEQIFHDARLAVLVLDVDVIAFDVAIKYTFGKKPTISARNSFALCFRILAKAKKGSYGFSFFCCRFGSMMKVIGYEKTEPKRSVG